MVLKYLKADPNDLQKYFKNKNKSIFSNNTDNRTFLLQNEGVCGRK